MAPKWAIDQPSFSRPRMKSGTSLTHGGSGNVILRSSVLGNPRKKFDDQYALTGGEDTDFFYRLHLAGCRMVWCDEAEVSEKIPQSRVDKIWLKRRAFRSGQNYYRIFISPQKIVKKTFCLAINILKIVFFVCTLPFSRATSTASYIKSLCRLYGVFGQVSAVFGEKLLYKEYAPTNYRATQLKKKSN